MGGAIYFGYINNILMTSTVLIKECNFFANNAIKQGGAIWISHYTLLAKFSN